MRRRDFHHANRQRGVAIRWTSSPLRPGLGFRHTSVEQTVACWQRLGERTVSRTPPLRRTDIVQVQGRSNESEMRKRLRKVTDLPLRLRIVFFRKQADIVANR